MINMVELQRQITGCVPATPQQVRVVKNKIGHWDAVDKPPVADYASFRKWLETEPTTGAQWWEYPDVEALFTKNQGSLGSCTGFAFTNARMITLIHQRQRWSEQKLEMINPFVTWCKSKGGGTSGGQTITEMALEANATGLFPVRVAGVYSDRLRWDSAWESPAILDVAATCQVGVSEIPYSGSELVDEIQYLCKHRRAVVFGATAYVTQDGKVSRCGGHAQAYGGYDEATGRIGYVNSWGDMYSDSGMGTVRFGRLIDRDTLAKMVSASWDVYCVTYAEAPYDKTIKPTLEI